MSSVVQTTNKLSMNKYLVRHDRPNCIGCGACASTCPGYWEMSSDGKSSLKGAKKLKDGSFELEIKEEARDCNQQATDVCPVKVINVVKK